MQISFSANQEKLPPLPVRMAWHQLRINRQLSKAADKSRDAREELQGLEDDGCFRGPEHRASMIQCYLTSKMCQKLEDRKAQYNMRLNELGIYKQIHKKTKSPIIEEAKLFDKAVRARARAIKRSNPQNRTWLNWLGL